MAGLRRDLLASVVAVVAMTLLLGLAYPLFVTGIAQIAFPGSADGSKVSYHGHVVGSKLIGQDFKGERRYFQPRPSATGYSGNVTYFGNGGPNSAEVREEIREELAAYVKLNKPYDHSLTREGVPVDAVTKSGSGVDPDISEANAQIQAHRVAAVRHLPLSKVEDLISAHTDGRSLGVLGEPGVNVLELNIALDELPPTGLKAKPGFAFRPVGGGGGGR